jgi:nickel-type superoxide dismutase maturation protease
LAAAVVAAAVVAGASGFLLRRLEVVGPSMQPTLRPGDRLLAVRLPAAWPLRRGDLVVLHDPRHGAAAPPVVKRVVGVDGRRRQVEVAGDNPAASTDSRTYGPVDRRQVVGRVLYRYGPPGRTGWLVGAGGVRAV